MTSTREETSPPAAEGPEAYEPPRLSPLGNLHGILAGSTQSLACDGGTFDPSSGDHPKMGGMC